MKYYLRILGYIAGALAAGFIIYILTCQYHIFNAGASGDGFTGSELEAIERADSIMRVLTIESDSDCFRMNFPDWLNS